MTRRLTLLACIAAIVVAGGVLTGALSFDSASGSSQASAGAIGSDANTPRDSLGDLGEGPHGFVEQSSSSGGAGVDLSHRQPAEPKTDAFPTGIVEGSVVLNGEALSMDSAVAALGSDQFDQFVLGLERGAKSPAAAAELTSAYRQGIETTLNALEGGSLDNVGCGESVCAFQVTTRADQRAFDLWLDHSFSGTRLPGYSFITAPIPGSSGAPSQYRVLVTIDPAARAISSRISP